MRRVAVVGSGISGLATAHALAGDAQVTMFEAGDYFGGHTHTVDVTLDGVTHGVDTGFLVFNHRTYPNLVRLFGELQVETAASDMSFSVQVHDAGLEWSGCNLNTVFAQRRNLLRPRFLRMLADILRFNKVATAVAERGAEVELAEPIGDFLGRHDFGETFRDWYLLPMIGCIWSCPTDQMLRFPIATMIRFCHNHGLIQVADRPQWHTVRGGAKHYVAKMLKSIPDARLRTPVRSVQRCRRATAAAASWWPPTTAANATTRSCWPATATRAWRCWPMPRPTKRPCWGPSSTTPTGPCCTPMPVCCRAAARPGRPGTMRARRTPAASRPPCACTTSSTGCSRCPGSSPCWCR